MEDGRVIEVIGLMRGGAKSKKKNPWTSSGEGEPEKVGTKTSDPEDGIRREIGGRNRDGENFCKRWRPGRGKRGIGGQVRGLGEGVGGVGSGAESGRE